MEHFPHIDDQVRMVVATPDRTWSALLGYVSHSIGRPLRGPLVASWVLEPRARDGDWGKPSPGATIPGFAVTEVDRPRLLTLRGRHRFSRYELRFSIEPVESDRVE